MAAEMRLLRKREGKTKREKVRKNYTEFND
jgi:hypothetical protein